MPDEYFDLPIELVNNHKEIFNDKEEKEHFNNTMFYGFDIDTTMLRISAMNLMQHGIEKKQDAKNGDIVVAMNDNNEATVKTFYKEKDYFRLQPENDTMNPIILKNVTILGKVIGLYRKF